MTLQKLFDMDRRLAGMGIKSTVLPGYVKFVGRTVISMI